MGDTFVSSTISVISMALLHRSHPERQLALRLPGPPRTIGHTKLLDLGMNGDARPDPGGPERVAERRRHLLIDRLDPHPPRRTPNAVSAIVGDGDDADRPRGVALGTVAGGEPEFFARFGELGQGEAGYGEVPGVHGSYPMCADQAECFGLDRGYLGGEDGNGTVRAEVGI